MDWFRTEPDVFIILSDEEVSILGWHIFQIGFQQLGKVEEGVLIHKCATVPLSMYYTLISFIIQ